jgi:hypothetical protein
MRVADKYLNDKTIFYGVVALHVAGATYLLSILIHLML